MQPRVANDSNMGLKAGPAAIEIASLSAQTDLLRTKLYIPPIHAQTISRPALLERLGSLGSSKLVLVSAPAGFGKTTLIAKWLAEPLAPGGMRRPAWLSLGETDNDPSRFWKYVIAAFQTNDPCAGLKLMDMLNRPALPPAETWLPVLLHDLEKIPAPMTLVLDDYQCIHARAIHQSLNYLIHDLPPDVRIVIITRADPPLQLARLRVQGTLAEIRAADLLFSASEIEDYLNDKLGLGVPADDLALLAQRTEGWPAGIQLVARSLATLSDDTDRQNFIRHFTGSNEYVLNYLLEEVLQQQPPAISDFLCRTSILNQLTAPLCAAVAGTTTAKAERILADLSHEHLFTNPLDDTGHWYRYHPLMSEALATRLREEHPQQWEKAHRLALDWFVAHGYHERAIRHALAAGQFETAAEIIERIGDDTWSAGDISSPLMWLDALPVSLRRERIQISILYIWVLVLNERIDEADALWHEANELVQSVPDSQTDSELGRLATLGGALAHLRERPEEAIQFCKKAWQHLPAEDSLWRAASQLICGRAYQAKGQSGLAVDVYQDMIELCAATGFAYLGFVAQADLNEAFHSQGRLYEAQAHCERMRETIPAPKTGIAALDSHACVCLGRLHYERNDLAAAERFISEGIDHIWPGGEARQVIVGRLLLARIHQLNGNRIVSRQQVEAALDLAVQLKLIHEERAIRATMARLALYDNEWEIVKCWQAGAGLSPNDLPDFRLEYEHRTLAEVLIAQGNASQAEALLARCRAAAARSGRAGSELPLALLYSIAVAQQNRLAEAEAVIRGVLPLAESQDFARSFLDLGPHMAELLRRTAVRNQAPAYIDRLCAYFNREAARENAFARMAKPTNGKPISAFTPASDYAELDSLTPREAEILCLIAGGASNQEIADSLVLSVGTIKGHVNHIFSKLDVHSRTAAVARARNYQLIEY